MPASKSGRSIEATSNPGSMPRAPTSASAMQWVAPASSRESHGSEQVAAPALRLRPAGRDEESPGRRSSIIMEIATPYSPESPLLPHSAVIGPEGWSLKAKAAELWQYRELFYFL